MQSEENNPTVSGARPPDGQFAQDLDPRGERRRQQEMVNELAHPLSNTQNDELAFCVRCAFCVYVCA